MRSDTARQNVSSSRMLVVPLHSSVSWASSRVAHPCFQWNV